jgi:hypothetical protein
MTPTTRAPDRLHRRGDRAAVVESWLPRVNRRRDLWGFGDVLAGAAHREPRFLIGQATTAGHVAGRLAKATGRPDLRAWLAAGGAFEVWGWYRRGPCWAVRRVAVRGDDLRDVLLDAPHRRRRHRQPELFS